MPRLSITVPKYRRHKASGQAVVTLNGRDFYLGAYGSPESKAAYHQRIAEWQIGGRQHPQASAPAGPTINQVGYAYLQFANSYYGDFGTPRILAPDGVTVRTTSAIGNRHLFTGRLWIANLGLYEYRFRFLDPRIGRFIHRDPAGYWDGLNLYAYLSHSPYNMVDPFGLCGQPRGFWGSVKEIYSIVTEGTMGLIEYPEIRAERLNPDNLAVDIGTGIAATADGIIPFADPFADADFYDACDSTNQLSQGLGAFARDIAPFAEALWALKAYNKVGNANRLIVVSRWGGNLGPGKFVMTGANSPGNYVASFKWMTNPAGYHSGVNYIVRAGQVRPPRGVMGYIEAHLGHRVVQFGK